MQSFKLLKVAQAVLVSNLFGFHYHIVHKKVAKLFCLAKTLKSPIIHVSGRWDSQSVEINSYMRKRTPKKKSV